MSKWEISKAYIECGFADNSGNVSIVKSDESLDYSVVATVTIQSHHKKSDLYKARCAERDANLAMICSAPEMFEILQMIANDGMTENLLQKTKEIVSLITPSKKQ